jgi:hypothetical protein
MKAHGDGPGQGPPVRGGPLVHALKNLTNPPPHALEGFSQQIHWAFQANAAR